MWQIEQIVERNGVAMAKVPSHPKSDKGGFVVAGQVIAENTIGRILKKNKELVLFIDGDKTNLSLDNLAVVTLQQHSSYHRTKRGETLLLDIKCPFCKTVKTVHRCNSHLNPKYRSKSNYTCCSHHCRASMKEALSETPDNTELLTAIAENVLREYTRTPAFVPTPLSQHRAVKTPS